MAERDREADGPLEGQRLLEELCAKHGVELELIEALFEIERDHQLMDRRHGIRGKLSECLRTNGQSWA